MGQGCSAHAELGPASGHGCASSRALSPPPCATRRRLRSASRTSATWRSTFLGCAPRHERRPHFLKFGGRHGTTQDRQRPHGRDQLLLGEDHRGRLRPLAVGLDDALRLMGYSSSLADAAGCGGAGAEPLPECGAQGSAMACVGVGASIVTPCSSIFPGLGRSISGCSLWSSLIVRSV